MNGFTVPAQLMTIRSMVDGGLGLGFHTKELSAQEKAVTMNFHMQAGWLLFSPNAVAETDVPSKLAEKFVKTPSQRLRASLFVLWEHEGKQGQFEEYYNTRMEQFINHVKSKLP